MKTKFIIMMTASGDYQIIKEVWGAQYLVLDKDGFYRTYGTESEAEKEVQRLIEIERRKENYKPKVFEV